MEGRRKRRAIERMIELLDSKTNRFTPQSTMEDLENALMGFKQELLTMVGPYLRAQLSGPAQLSCKMHAGQGLVRLLAFSGDEVFSIAGSTTTIERGKAVVKLNLAPVLRQEYAYASVTESQFNLFRWRCTGASLPEVTGTFDQAFDTALGLKHKSGRTYREIHKAAVDHTRGQFLATQLQAHADFASW